MALTGYPIPRHPWMARGQMQSGRPPNERALASVLDRAQQRIDAPGLVHRRSFDGTYRHAARAVGAAVADASFEDPAWAALGRDNR